jgi:hypothetical protein
MCAESAICRSSLAVAAAGRRTIWGYRQLDKFFSLEIHTHNCVCIKKGSVGRHVQQRVAHTHTNYSQSTARWSWRRRKVIINVCVMEVGQKMKSNRAVSLSSVQLFFLFIAVAHTAICRPLMCFFFLHCICGSWKYAIGTIGISILKESVVCLCVFSVASYLLFWPLDVVSENSRRIRPIDFAWNLETWFFCCCRPILFLL